MKRGMERLILVLSQDVMGWSVGSVSFDIVLFRSGANF